ncbi:hypothetical protein HYDPIDRAFT_32939 [Hydnomerulius pinastri MD-312]|uniref:Response regulatory domain-containing protein n=1 Tax=Hydnomerulius pinastri MD-312 TaxID=994086 RepID=A0A0C9W1G4_9AGAM|nr:hypothetical protein HYDPIDRAFT_32939 [Hydnomerulius pinastri MD-312]
MAFEDSCSRKLVFPNSPYADENVATTSSPSGATPMSKLSSWSISGRGEVPRIPERNLQGQAKYGKETSVVPARASEMQVTPTQQRLALAAGFAVPPRVLIVSNDVWCRVWCSKALRGFGCTISVAADVAGVVGTMNLVRYDLILMDIDLPKLNEISAILLIQHLDHTAPIISMTSNLEPGEIMANCSSGKNDVLPQPFTQRGLLGALHKHLTHLLVIRQSAEAPGAANMQPRPDNSIDEAPASGPTSLPDEGVWDDDRRANPQTGAGVSAGRPRGPEENPPALMLGYDGQNQFESNGSRIPDRGSQPFLKDLPNGGSLPNFVIIPDSFAFRTIKNARREAQVNMVEDAYVKREGKRTRSGLV